MNDEKVTEMDIEDTCRYIDILVDENKKLMMKNKLLIEELYKLKKKSAELMLEQLGYKNTGYLTGNSINFENKDCETSISIFDNERGRDIHICALGDTYKNSGFIGVEELKAIYMYCDALGWFDGDSN